MPPRFSSDVLGHGDPGISRGVTIRHAEGIYSRRQEASSYQMQEPEQRGETNVFVLELSAKWTGQFLVPSKCLQSIDWH